MSCGNYWSMIGHLPPFTCSLRVFEMGPMFLSLLSRMSSRRQSVRTPKGIPTAIRSRFTPRSCSTGWFQGTWPKSASPASNGSTNRYCGLIANRSFFNGNSVAVRRFFAEIVSLIYRAEDEEPGDVSEERKNMARLGHDLLDSWRAPPGSTEDGYVNAQELREWVDHARRLVAAGGRGAIGDEVIGRVLSGSPRGQDDTWPVEAIRDVIENVVSKDLEHGFEVGTFNGRGVVTKNPAEGGEQERQLTKRYEKHAEAVRDRWPRTTAMLRRIAETYRAEARREDDRSELMGNLDV